MSLDTGDRLTPDAPARTADASPGLVWATLAVALAAIASLAASVRTVDLAYQVRIGDLILSTGELVRTEVLSFVDPGHAWLNQQWLAQLLLAVAYRLGRFDALVALRAVAFAGLGIAMYAGCRRRGARAAAASVLTIAGIVIGFPSLGLRPQLFGALLFASALWVLAWGADHPRRRWWLVPIGVVWANVHGSFVLLPAILTLAAVEAVVRGRRADATQLVGVGLVATAATVVTPYGTDAWRYVVELTTNDQVRRQVTEWAPTSLVSIDGWLLAGSAVAAVFILVRAGTEAWVSLVWLVPSFALALTARRNVVWWGLVAAWVVAGVVTREQGKGSARPRIRAIDFAIIATLGIGCVVLSPWVRGVSLEDAPAALASTTAGATQPGARLLVAQRYASWFELAVPDRLVFVDSRIEQYPPTVWEDYRTVVRGDPSWRGVVERWKVDAIVTEPDWPIVDELRRDPSWREVAHDADGSVFVRA